MKKYLLILMLGILPLFAFADGEYPNVVVIQWQLRNSSQPDGPFVDGQTILPLEGLEMIAKEYRSLVIRSKELDFEEEFKLDTDAIYWKKTIRNLSYAYYEDQTAISTITANDNAITKVYSLDGKCILSARTSAWQLTKSLPRGVYVIHTKDRIFKIVK